MTILIAIGVLAFLVFIHELGHFVFAKLSNVYVEKFSIGFGPKVVGFKYGETEYLISAIPLGGYVKMYGESPDDIKNNETPELVGRALTDVNRFKRALIVIGGPLFNFLLAIVIFWGLFASGIPDYKAQIGTVDINSPAEIAGLKIGDLIVKADQENIQSWSELSSYIALNPNKNIEITLDDGTVKTVTPRVVDQPNALNETEAVGDIGIGLVLPPIIGRVVPDYPANKAELIREDKIISINNESVSNWNDVRDKIRANPATELLVKVDRDGKTVDLKLTPMESKEGELTVGIAGVSPIEGNILVSYGFFESLKLGVIRSYDFSKLIFVSLGKLISGSAPTDQVGGPIMIVKTTADSADSGPGALLFFIAIISINLAVFNLLPIPVLDGGHLFILAVESITRRKINEKIIGGFQTVGLLLLLSLMAFAFYNDITKLFMN